MKLLALLLLPSLVLVPVMTLIQSPVKAIVQQVDVTQKARVDELIAEGMQLYRESRYSEALDKWQQGLALAKTIGHKSGEGTTLNNIGLVYQSLGQYPKALEYYEQSLVIKKAIGDKSGESTTLNNIGGIYDSLGQYPKALEYYEQSLVISKVIGDKSGESTTLNNIGVVYRSLGRYPKALEYYEQSLAISKVIGDKSGEGTTLNNIGGIYDSLGQYPKALEYYEQSLVIRKAIGDKSGEGTTLNNIGIVYQSLGRYPKALEYYEQSLVISKAIGDKSGESNTLSNIGVVYKSLGQYPKALEYYQQSLVIKKAIGDKSGEGTTLNNIGVVYQSLGRYPKALEYYEQSLVIRKAIGDKSGESTTLNNIGGIYDSLEKYPKALEYYEQSLVIRKAIGDKFGESNALGNIGVVYYSLGQYPKALEYYQQSLVIAKAIRNKSGEGTTLNNIGAVYQSLEQYSKALEYFKQSLAIAKAIGNKSGESQTLSNIGDALLKQKNPALAEKSLREAIAIWETIRGSKNNSGQGLSDSDKVSFADRVAETYKLLQRSLIEQNKPQAALEIAERGRARALAELLASRSVDAATNTLKLPKSPNLVKIQQIAKSQNATLVEYSLIDDTIYIWVIPPNGSITFKQSKLPPNTTIKDLVNTSRDDIGVRGRSGSRNTPSSPAAAQGDLKLLHKLLIEPIAKSLPKDPNQRIIFIPQGELFFVPFVALQDSNDKYLIEQHTISTASAIGLLDSTPKPAKFNPKQGTSIVVGNPIMPLAPDGTQLVPLAGAEKEAIAIGSILKTTPLIGAKADKNVVISKMRSASIIHLATHGLLDKVKGDIPGAIALTNGLLTSNEIFDLKLQANLVVLSACDTGGGDLSGDGVIGLSRALAVAGTPSVAVSLWSVNDSATQELMVEFYQNWYGKGMDKDQSMRQAMLEVMKSREKPRDWAAFTILGEAR
jgi:tetratricopeptide (TPR) repeat protein